MHLLLKTSPTFEPVTLADLKRQTVIEHDADDHYLMGLIEQAREQVESDTGRALVKQTWQLLGECFPDEIIVPKPPLVSVTHIKYIDTDGVQQTLNATDYQIITTNHCARIKPASGKSWPAVQNNNYAAVEVEFVCGYLTEHPTETGSFSGEVPHRAKAAVLIFAAHLYENRELMSPVAMSELPSYSRLLSGLEIVAI